MKNADDALSGYLRDLLNDLDAVAGQHGEIADTEVREQMFDAVHKGFLQPQAGYVLPERFGLHEPEGDARARAALERYLTRARERAEQRGLNTPRERLNAFQAEVYSDQETSGDEYFGWADEERL